MSNGGGKTQSIGDKVKTFAGGKKGQMVGDGECFTLADQALKDAGAKSAADYGKVTADADYVWGTETSKALVQAGDIVQFRNYKFEITTKTKTTKTYKGHPKYKDQSTDGEEWQTQSQERPHHTAIVSSKDSASQWTILEQNIAPMGSDTPVKQVQLNELHTADSTKTTKTESTVIEDGGPVKVTVETTVTIKVTGTVKVYRPQAK
jgi:hypothetical protein